MKLFTLPITLIEIKQHFDNLVMQVRKLDSAHEKFDVRTGRKSLTVIASLFQSFVSLLWLSDKIIPLHKTVDKNALLDFTTPMFSQLAVIIKPLCRLKIEFS